MYKQVHQPTTKIEITLPKVLTIIASILLFLIIPIQLTTLVKSNIDQEKEQQETTTSTNQGTVAGVSTQKENKEANILGVSIKEDESSIYIITGTVLIGISFLLILYLYKETKQSKNFNSKLSGGWNF